MRASRKAFLPASLLAAVMLTIGLVLAPCVSALADEPTKKDTPGELARESIEQMMRALRLLVDSIPQYELPEMLDNGDIIIRRRSPQDPGGENGPEVDETAT